MNAMLNAADRAVTDRSTGRGAGRRLLRRLAGTGALVLGALAATGGTASAQVTLAWDKTFPQSTRVDHQKVSFYNRLGIQLVADLYVPKGLDGSRRYPALIVGHPYGGVKEQTSGLYAQTMAERGFITLAFDASYNGESGGQPHFISSHEAFVEDFSAAVDYLGTNARVDRERIGVIGVCGSGSFVISAAKIDPRMKAIATVSMYDMGAVNRDGLNRSQAVEQRKRIIAQAAERRHAEFTGGNTEYTGGTVHELTPDTDPIQREFYDFYRTPRGEYTPRGSSPELTTHPTLTSNVKFMNFYPFNDIETISPRPMLFISGDQAHSREFSEDAYRRAAEPKELVWVPDAGHVDLYDRVDLIPFDRLESFFTRHLA
jgi:uncharacterized protein